MQNETPDNINILVVTGGKNPGHSRDAGVFFKVLKDGFKVIEISLAELSRAGLEMYNIVVVFTSLESADDKQLDLLVDYIRTQNKVLALFHEASIYRYGHSGFKSLMGVRFKNHDDYGNVEILTSPHVLTEGIQKSFFTRDEFYYYHGVDSLKGNCRVIMSRPLDNYPVCFVKELESGSILTYLSLGHDSASIENKNFQQFIANLPLLLKNK